MKSKHSNKISHICFELLKSRLSRIHPAQKVNYSKFRERMFLIKNEPRTSKERECPRFIGQKSNRT